MTDADVEIKELVPAALLEKHDTMVRLAVKSDVEVDYKLLKLLLVPNSQ